MLFTIKKSHLLSLGVVLSSLTLNVTAQELQKNTEPFSLNSSARKVLQVPYEKGYAALFGTTDANSEYTNKVREFLQNLGVESKVAIKRISIDDTSITASLFDLNKASFISFGGIWLNEKKLAALKEPELIFQLAYAATAFSMLSLKDTAVQTLLMGLPYAALVGANWFLFLKRPSGVVVTTGGIMGWLYSAASAVKIAALPALNYAGISLSNRFFSKPLTTMHAKTVELETAIAAAIMLVQSGHSWAVDEYTQLLKAAISDNTIVFNVTDYVPLKELFGALNGFLVEQNQGVPAKK